jgi:hypothetical protein
VNKTVECGGCSEMKPAGEFRTSAMGDYLCADFQKCDVIMAEYGALENEECRLVDAAMEIESALYRARETVLRLENELVEAQRKIGQNHRKMADFDWQREVSG